MAPRHELWCLLEQVGLAQVASQKDGVLWQSAAPKKVQVARKKSECCELSFEETVRASDFILFPVDHSIHLLCIPVQEAEVSLFNCQVARVWSLALAVEFVVQMGRGVSHSLVPDGHADSSCESSRLSVVFKPRSHVGDNEKMTTRCQESQASKVLVALPGRALTLQPPSSNETCWHGYR